ncbi:BsaA family SipW-dependent biofilm matrix protein [Enterococcus sp.]|uniref:BsaA family SipW-dependent biofilm matrix protein n=1 Tax=Enterococcus sp. TaxID=35783 RepID=UPI00290C1BF4|nr:BsaA family SipW-dependent biofilm matrix protein [Enterococcus sp.]MDU5333439.1 BsaA family SipW-dependent biofilm matrix protein [Enterococcus sp.]
MNSKKKKAVGISLVMAVILVLIGTFAWFTSTDNVTNKFKTGALPDGSVKIVEDFEEPDGWTPGQEVKKKVGVLSNSDDDVVVRLSFEETLQKMESDGNKLKQYAFPTEQTDTSLVPVPSIDFSSNGYSDPTTLGLTVSGVPSDVTIVGKEVFTNKYEFALYRTVSGKLYKMDGDFAYDLTTQTVTVSNVNYLYYKLGIYSEKDWADAPHPAASDITKSALDDKILLGYSADVEASTVTANKWVYDAAGGWFYYIGKLAPGETSPLILESVKLDGSANNTYQLMDYALDVRIEALQATEEAIDGGGFPGIPTNIANAIKAEL